MMPQHQYRGAYVHPRIQQIVFSGRLQIARQQQDPPDPLDTLNTQDWWLSALPSAMRFFMVTAR
jgi:hypothetical protein